MAFDGSEGGFIKDFYRTRHGLIGVVGMSAVQFVANHDTCVKVFQQFCRVFPCSYLFPIGFGVFGNGGIINDIKMGGIHGYSLLYLRQLKTLNFFGLLGVDFDRNENTEKK